MELLTRAINNLAFGILTAWSFQVVYLADVLVGVITMVLVWSLPVPRKDKEYIKSSRTKKLFVWKSYYDALSLLVKGTVEFRKLTVVAIVVWTLSAVLNIYSQGLLSGEGLGTNVIPLIFAITTLPDVGGSWFASMFRTQCTQQRGIIVLTWLYVVSGLFSVLNLPSASGTIFFESLDELADEGLIDSSPRAKSVYLTEEGIQKAKELAKKYLKG